MRNILLAPNSFKGCADSVLTARYLSESLKNELKDYQKAESYTITEKPLSDGGDGFLEVCSRMPGMHILTFEIPLPFGNDLTACRIGYHPADRIIYIESALVLGLNLIPPDKRHLLELSSRGMGELINAITLYRKAGRLGFDKVVIGIGGTGINDLGIGMASRFGLELTDKAGQKLEPLPVNFIQAADIIWNRPDPGFEIEIITDVENSLLGPKGASREFAPQKGASEEEVILLEKSFENIISILKKKDPSLRDEDLSGAGGGLAAGLFYFLGGKYRNAADFILHDLGINSTNIHPDLVITGEGSFDDQTYMKKGAMLIIDEFAHTAIPVAVIAGSVNISEAINENVRFFPLIRYFTSEEESIRRFQQGLELAVKEIVQEYF